MNRIYRKVWNKELGQLVVASEFAKADSTGVVGGGRSGVLRPSLLCAALFAAGLVGMSGAAWAEVGNGGGTRDNNSGSMASSPANTECNNIGGTAAGQATAIGLRAIAVGCGSQARENSVSMGTGAGGGGNSTNAVAIGHNAGRNVDGDYNIAIGSGAGNNVGPGGALLGTNNVAIGRGSGNNVVGEANFALGKFSGNNITGFNNISIGEYTNYGINSNLNIAIGQFAAAYGGVGNSVAIGQKAVASGGSSISIGNASDASGTGTVVVGFRAGAGSNADRWHSDGPENPGVAFGTADGTGGGYNAFFGAQSGQRVTGGDNVGVGNLAANGLTGTDNVAIGARANNYGNYTDDAGTNWAGSQQTASRTTAIGARTRASADDSVALGHSANASIANSVALGANSTTVAAVNTANTVINGTTYNFAGGSAAGVVSVGSAGEKRQVHNVAAGRLSDTSTDAVNGSQLFATNQAVLGLADTPITFAGDSGSTDITLGETLNVTGGAAPAGLTDGNIGVVAGANGLEIKLNKDIDLGDDGSLAIGDAELDNEGLVVDDGDSSTTIGAGSIDVADADGNVTSIGGTQVEVGGTNAITIDGDAGTIEGLANVDLDGDDFAQAGRAATEEQLDLVNQTANAGWNLTGSGEDEVNIGPNGSVDFQGDQNITVAQTGEDQDGVIQVTLNRELDVDRVTAGDSVLDTDGLVVTDDDGNVTTVAADDVTVTDGDASTSIGAGVVTVAGSSSTIVIDGDTGTIGGLTNQTIDYPDFADGTGRAATEDQLDLVNQTANAGWNLTGSGEDEVNIGPNGSVDFQGDQNITVAQTGNDQEGVIEVTLNRDLDVDSVTAGDTVVDGTGVGVGDDVHLGDTGLVIGDADGPRFTNDGISAGGQVITNVAPGVDGTDAVNVDQLTGLANTPLTFAGDAGTDVDRLLGETVNLVGGAIDETTLTDGNIGVVADGSDTLEIKLNKDIDLGEDGSLEIGDTLVDTDGLVVTDDDGNVTVVAADGTTVEDDAGNVTTVAAGNVTVTDGDGSTSIGAGVVTVAGTSSTITIDGDAGTIGGLTNTTFDPNATYTGGVAATQEQLSQVNTDLTAAGLDFVGDDGQVVHRDLGEELSITGGADLDALSSGNIGVTSNDDEDGLVIELADNIELTEEGSISIGDTYIDGDEIVTNNLTVGGTTQLGDHFTVNEGGVYYDGPITEGDHIVNKAYVDDGIDELANTPLTFAGDAGDDVERRLGETVNLVGGATDEAALTEGNIGVVADGTDTLEIKLNKDIDLGSDGSVAIGNTTVNNAGLTVAVATGSTTVGAGFVSVEGAGGTVMVDGNLGTIGGLTNTTFDPDNYTSGQAATEDQLKQVSDVANAGWNVSVDGEGAVADNNVGPGGTVDFSNNDGNIEIDRDGTDLVFDLADDITVDSVTAGDTYIDTTGVAVGADVHLGNTGLVIHGGPSVTITGINAGNLVITNVAPGEISATSTDAINGSQLHGMGDSIVNVIGGNAELNPDGTITTSDIGGTGHDNIDDAIRAANDAANAGWTATDADGNAANIGPNGSVAFTGDGNISVAQTGEDNNGQVEITLNRDLDVDSITAGNTVIDTDGVQVGENVHLGDTGLVIEGGPSVTTDGIDAGGKTIGNVAAGVADTDAVNVGQLKEVAGDVIDQGNRLTIVEGDVNNLKKGAEGPFQVSQDNAFVAPTPTGANSAAGGNGADASGANSTAIGNQSVASGADSTALGQGAKATHDNSVALGKGSATTVGAQTGYDAAYVGSSNSAGEVNVGNRTITGVAPGVAGTDAVNVNQLNAGVNHAVVTANEYTDQRFNQVQSDVWHLHGRVDELEKEINSGVATAMAMRQAPYVAGATTYYAGFGAYKDQGALGVSLRRTADNGRWSLEGGFSANRDGAGGYIGVSGVLGGK